MSIEDVPQVLPSGKFRLPKNLEQRSGTSTKGLNRSVVRALNLLQDIATSELPPSFSELQKRHNLPKGTLHNLLHTLQHHDFVKRKEVTGHYRIGFSVLEVAATSAANVDDLGRILASVLEPLVERCQETCHLGVLSGFSEQIIRRIDHAAQVVRIAPQVQRRHQAHSTSGGLAALALMSNEEIRGLLPDQLETRTPNTITTQEALFKRLAKIREDGFSIDMEEAYLGVRCVAVAIKVPGWQTVTVSFTLPLQRAPLEHLVSLVEPLRESASKIELILRVTPVS
jgi:DNA-binding IclR family transcriptional regulator|tara:strand:+ start:106 stop:957 length:852 start_codon:yes stop_codon:yes gene_type:complete